MTENAMTTLNEKIAERVGKELIDLIDPEDWKNIINQEVNKFKTVTLPKIVQEEMNKMYRDHLVAAVNDLFSESEWDSMRQEFVYPKIREFIGQNGGVILSTMLENPAAIALQDLKNRLTSQYY